MDSHIVVVEPVLMAFAPDTAIELLRLSAAFIETVTYPILYSVVRDFRV